MRDYPICCNVRKEKVNPGSRLQRESSDVLSICLSCYSLAAGHSAEAVDVVGAAGLGVVTAAGTSLIALLHILEHLAAAGVAHAVGRPTEVGREEGAEAGDLGTSVRGSWNLRRVGRGEEEGRVDLEALHVGVSKHANAH